MAINDPYRPYYDAKVMDYKLSTREDAATLGKETTEKRTLNEVTTVTTLPKISSEKEMNLRGPPKEPTRFDFLSDIGPISSVDL